MKIGLIAGAMKPFHAGHDVLVEKACSECDQVLIFTSHKSRDNIAGMQMVKAWIDIIIPQMELLGRNVELRLCNSPIGSIFEYLEDENEDNSQHVYRIYQGLEDRARFSPDTIKKYCPWLNVELPAYEDADSYDRTKNTEVYAKGELVRQSLSNGDYVAFKTYLPSWLGDNGMQYFNILRGK